jgi:Uncharacterized protein conserved in bacteria (DUF2188)
MIMLKIYRVLQRQGKWQVLLPHTQAPIVSGDDRSPLVDWARELAREHGGEVQVYDHAGNPEATHRFIDGVEKTTVMN